MVGTIWNNHNHHRLRKRRQHTTTTPRIQLPITIWRKEHTVTIVLLAVANCMPEYDVAQRRYVLSAILFFHPIRPRPHPKCMETAIRDSINVPLHTYTTAVMGIATTTIGLIITASYRPYIYYISHTLTYVHNRKYVSHSIRTHRHHHFCAGLLYTNTIIIIIIITEPST